MVNKYHKAAGPGNKRRGAHLKRAILAYRKVKKGLDKKRLARNPRILDPLGPERRKVISL